MSDPNPSDATQPLPVRTPAPAQGCPQGCPQPGMMLPPQGYPMHPGMPQHLGYPTGYLPMPAPYGMPPGYGVPPGYGIPPGYPQQMPMPPELPPQTMSMDAGLSLDRPASPARAHLPAPASGPRKRNRFIEMWRKIGGGSLTLSLAIHAGIIIVGGLIVFTTTLQEKAVDFLPGGGSQQGAQASSELTHKVQQKKRSKLNHSIPKQRLVSTSLAASITLPEAPPDLLDVPDVSSSFGGVKVGSGGAMGFGSGGGFSHGMGLGGAKGFVGMTLFGKLGGDGMPGVFYDLKQGPDRKPSALGFDTIQEGPFAEVINTAANKKFSGKGLDAFFHSTQKMSFTYLLIPYMSAEEGPKAFKVEKEVQPRGWIVHYTATVRPPVPGDYRFVGLFDDALIVYVNGKPVLDGSWYSIVDHGQKRKDENIREDFGGPIVPGTGARRCYAGKWVKMDGTTQIDIVVGERPGGRVGGLLLIQAKKGKYAERADKTPILPVFTTTAPTLEDTQRFRDFTASGFEVAEDVPVFNLGKDVFGDR